MADSQRCSICGVSWPHDERFETCPKCGEETTWITNAPEDEIIPLDEAVSQKNHLDFEAYYERTRGVKP